MLLSRVDSTVRQESVLESRLELGSLAWQGRGRLGDCGSSKALDIGARVNDADITGFPKPPRDEILGHFAFARPLPFPPPHFRKE